MEQQLSTESPPEFDYKDYSEDGKAVTEDEYWQHYYECGDFNYEWNNGFLEEVPMADYESTLFYDWVVGLLKEYLKVNPIAYLIFLEIGFRMKKLPKVNSIRKPDLGIVLKTNPVDLGKHDMSYKGICDLCLESLSFSSLKDINRDLVTKKKEYEASGVKEYFIIDRRHIETAFYRLNNFGKYEPIRPVSGGVIRSEVLPGFAFRLNDLKNLTDYLKLVEDPVYKPYLMKYYQDLQHATVQEEQLKDEALKREVQERQLKEKALEREVQERQLKEKSLERETQERQLKEQALKRETDALKREAEAQAEIERLRALLEKSS